MQAAKTIALPAEVEDILDRLQAAGHEAYAVGGCVRDTLLGKEPEDWDITTSARPGQVKQVFGRTIDTGIQHGTVTVMRNRVGYEITTYRVDGEYEDGRHPSRVAFTSSLLEDLKRRDFTINAMAYNHRDGLVDAFDGAGDLERGIVRCVGDPWERFSEDALRMLRAVRFSGQLDFSIDGPTREAIVGTGPNLEQVSRERVQTELTKLLLSGRPERIAMVYGLGLAPHVSGAFLEVPGNGRFLSAGLTARKHLRWAAFLCPAGGRQAERVLRDLKMDKDTIGKARTLADWWREPLPEDGAGLRRAMGRMPEGLYRDLLELKRVTRERADAEGIEVEGLQDTERLARIARASLSILEHGDCLYLGQLAVGGQDLIAAGMRPGKALGDILGCLLGLVHEHPEWNTKERLLTEARCFMGPEDDGPLTKE